MAVTESQAVAATKAFAQLSIQTSDQNNTGSNTGADLLYDDSSEIQGNWTLFYADVLEKISNDETLYGVTLSDIQMKRAIAYGVRIYFEQKSSDYSATKIKNEGYEINRTSLINNWEDLYNKVFEEAVLIANAEGSAGVEPDAVVATADSIAENYPDEWKPVIELEEIDEVI